MAYIDIESVDIKDSGPTFEKFDVEKNDKALIHIPENKVVQEFVHVMHRDEPTMIERNGRKVPEWSRESFAGTFICLGDFETVLSSPSYGDPANCPACAAMNKGPKLVERPKRTFALNVVRYATNRRSYDLRNNNVDVQIWRHADVRKLEPVLMAARQQPLNTIDFMVEADNSDWKKYIIQPKLGDPTFVSNDELKSNMKNAYGNLFPEASLTDACGRKLSKDALQSEIGRLESEYRLASQEESDLFGGTASTSQDTTSVDVTERTSENDLVPVSMNDLDEISNSLFD